MCLPVRELFLVGKGLVNCAPHMLGQDRQNIGLANANWHLVKNTQRVMALCSQGYTARKV